jgi:acyl-CoA thioesterase FadM
VSTTDGDDGFVHEMPAPDEGNGVGVHLSNLGVAQVLFESRNAFWQSLVVDGGIWREPVIPLIRELLIRYEAEVMPGAPLRCTIAVVSRSRRAFVMEESVTDMSDATAPRLVATCRGVHVAVDSDKGAPVDIPGMLIDAIENCQGAPVPQAGRWSTSAS